MIIKLIQLKMNKRPMDTDLKIRMSPSLGLLTIANILNKEHTILIENENIRDINFDEKVDVVGITVTVDVLPRAIEIAKKYRKINVPVVVGGIHITAVPEKYLEYFDVISVGMAETTWPDIIRDLENNNLKKVYYGNTKINGSHIVSPAYNLIDKKDYLYSNIVSTSRGCPFKCDFCYNSCNTYSNFYVNRPIDDVIKDIKTIGKKHIMFIDDNFIGNPQWTREFLKAIKPLKLIWNAAVTANIANMPDLLDEMASAGCQSLFIGFESINKESLINVNKSQNNVEQFEKLVQELHKRDIMINASFVFGLDGDDKNTFKTTLQWIVDNKIETVTSHILTPYPGTKLYDEMLNSGRIIDFDLSKYNTANVVFKPKNMTKEELYNGYINIYKEIYSFKNIIKRIPRSKKQILPYLAFNILYRKFGTLSEKICKIITFEKVGYVGEWLSYRIK